MTESVKESTGSLSQIEHFSVIRDPRRMGGNKRHRLDKILGIAVCAILSGAETWAGVNFLLSKKRNGYLNF